MYLCILILNNFTLEAKFGSLLFGHVLKVSNFALFLINLNKKTQNHEENFP